MIKLSGDGIKVQISAQSNSKILDKSQTRKKIKDIRKFCIYIEAEFWKWLILMACQPFYGYFMQTG